MENKLSATELLLLEHNVSEETRRAAARLVRLFGEAHLGSFYNSPDIAIVEHTGDLKSLEKHIE